MEPHTLVASAAIVAAPLTALAALRRGDPARAVRWASCVLLVGAVLAVLSVTLLGATAPAGRVNLVPGASLFALTQEDPRNAPENVFGNIALFLPLGFLGVLALRRGVLVVTLLGLVLSLGIEASQLVLGNRWVDVDDVILNTTGALLGALAATIATAAIRRPR